MLTVSRPTTAARMKRPPRSLRSLPAACQCLLAAGRHSMLRPPRSLRSLPPEGACQCLLAVGRY